MAALLPPRRAPGAAGGWGSHGQARASGPAADRGEERAFRAEERCRDPIRFELARDSTPPLRRGCPRPTPWSTRLGCGGSGRRGGLLHTVAEILEALRAGGWWSSASPPRSPHAVREAGPGGRGPGVRRLRPEAHLHLDQISRTRDTFFSVRPAHSFGGITPHRSLHLGLDSWVSLEWLFLTGRQK